jgi:prevent-host-death family protein
VKIAELRRNLSGYLRKVRNGAEILVCDRDTPVARISPIAAEEYSEETLRLAAEGKIRLPEKPWSVEKILALPGPDIPAEALSEAMDWARGER